MNRECDFWSDKRILVVGASSDLCTYLLPDITEGMQKVGLHFSTNPEALEKYAGRANVRLFQQTFRQGTDSAEVVHRFVQWAGGIDFLVILTGNCRRPVYWEEMTEAELLDDYFLNTVVSFQLANSAQKYMKEKGGRIVFTGTASAQNAGGSNSLSYGAAKLGLECIMKRMAKDCAKNRILINMVAPGYIGSKFHTKVMHRSKEELARRAEFVPLKRAGTLEEVASPYFFLLSEDASFITGEVLNVKGGDWI